MSIESHSDARSHAAEAVDSSASTPGQRPFPEGLVIHASDSAEQGLADTSWQARRVSQGDPIEKDFHLYPEFHGEPCGKLSASFVVVRNGNTITDKYVHLGNLDVTPTEKQPEIRNKGIGSALLTEMEKYAKRFGASYIQVVLSTKGITDTPTLPDFYRNRGYQLTALTPGAKPGGFIGIKPL